MDLADLAYDLVVGGRVVPGLGRDHTGAARSWWWPLPDANDRQMLLGLLDDGSVAAQQRLAARLADETDRVARWLLADAEAEPTPRSTRKGRRSAVEDWLISLYSTDPYLPASASARKIDELTEQLNAWVAAAALKPGSVQLCLRIVEPESPDEPTWKVEPLVRDHLDVSLMVPVGELFAGTNLFAPDAIEDALQALGLMARVAPELGAIVAMSPPGPIDMNSHQLVEMVSNRHALLADIGVSMLLPSWWARGKRVGLKVKSTSSSTPSNSGEAASGFGLDSLVSFSLEASLGGQLLTDDELDQLHAAAQAKQRLINLRGEWLEVEPDKIEAMLAKVGSTSTASASSIMRAALGLDDLDLGDEVDIEDIEVEGWLGDLLDSAVSGRVEAVDAPAGFDGSLRPYQQRGVGWLSFLGRLGLGACLADDMGLGKTAQLIASVLNDRGEGDSESPTLVVSPVSVLGNWQREIARFAPELSVMVHHGLARAAEVEEFVEQAQAHDMVLTTYSLVHRDRDLLAAVRWARVALDEAQQIKNPGTKVARAIRSIPSNTRVALTGTPVENHLGELWSIMQFLNPGLLGSMADFRRRFAKPIELERDAQATATLARITGPFILRRLKTDPTVIDDLPPKIETVARCVLTKEQATLYQGVVDQLLDNVDEVEEDIERRGMVLAAITKLKQICNHPAHFLGDGTALEARSGKLSRVEELIDEMLSVGDKALIFTQYTAWGERLSSHLSARFGVEALWLHGGVKRQARDEMVERFGTDDGPPLMLLSLKAGGTGLNLTAASHVIHYDRWWNPAVENQATDRAYRIGQTRTVQVHKMVTNGTVEDQIDKMIERKRELADSVVDSGEAWLTELSTDELAEVVRLSSAAEVI